MKAVESKDEKISESAQKRLKEVYTELEAIGADKAESRARRILSVSKISTTTVCLEAT